MFGLVWEHFAVNFSLGDSVILSGGLGENLHFSGFIWRSALALRFPASFELVLIRNVREAGSGIWYGSRWKEGETTNYLKARGLCKEVQ